MKNIPTQDILKRGQGALDKAGIEINVALKVLLIAAVSGLIAALLDRIIDLPTRTLIYTFGGFVAVLNGPLYAFFKGKDNLAGLIMSAVAGFVALLIWWIVTKIIGSRDLGYNITYNPASAWNIPKVFVDGIILGLIGFGWFAGLRRLPAKFLS